MSAPEQGRVTGIGGIFFKARDPQALRDWYSHKLGIQLEGWGGAIFRWKSDENPSGVGSTVLSIFEPDSDKFGSSASQFMLNFRVDNVAALLERLRAAGCEVSPKADDFGEYGKFGWVTDPEGNRVELWEPPEGR
jgi:predicted enzyme related to lactoylglutathione lyase